MPSTISDGYVSGTVSGTAMGGNVNTRTFQKGHSTLIISNGAGDRVTPNAFLQQETHCSGGVIDGIVGWDFDWWYYSYQNYPSRLYDYYNRIDTLEVPSGLANRLIAGTSPDRADVLLPVAVFELKDLPLAIYHAGRKLFKGPKPSPKHPRKPGATQAAADWVALNFGWMPLVGDLKALMNFSELAAKREKEFEKLYSGRGLKRRHNLHSNSVPRQESYAVGSPFNADTAVLKGDCNQKIWGVVHWKPAGVSGSPLERVTPDYIKRAVLGLNAANITANIWEAIPWSWFVDYFFGVQNYLVANAGLRSAVPGGACIMTHHKTVLTHPPLSLTDPFQRTTKLSAGVLVNESKERTPVYPEFIEAGFPILSVKQLSILGALAVLKAPR